MSIPLEDGINRHNAFEQKEETLIPKLINVENSKFVDYYLFKSNGSEYKG